MRSRKTFFSPAGALSENGLTAGARIVGAGLRIGRACGRQLASAAPHLPRVSLCVVVELGDNVDNVDDYESMVLGISGRNLAAGDLRGLRLDFHISVFGPVIVVLLVMFTALDRVANVLVEYDDLKGPRAKTREARSLFLWRIARCGPFCPRIDYFTRHCFARFLKPLRKLNMHTAVYL